MYFFKPLCLKPNISPYPLIFKSSEKNFLLVQPNITQDIKLGPDSFLFSMDKLIDLSARNRNADLIIWPESALPVLLSDNEQIRKHIMDSIDGDSSLLVGNIRIDNVKDYKKAQPLVELLGNTQTIIAGVDRVIINDQEPIYYSADDIRAECKLIATFSELYKHFI